MSIMEQNGLKINEGQNFSQDENAGKKGGRIEGIEPLRVSPVGAPNIPWSYLAVSPNLVPGSIAAIAERAKRLE